MNPALFSSASDEWETPPELFAELHREFTFDIDLAATSVNALCHAYFDATTNALTQQWHKAGTVGFCNPPYSRKLQKEFCYKALGSSLLGFTTVLLLPARTDTRVFHDCFWDADNSSPRVGIELRFLKGRLKFRRGGKVLAPAPFPSMVVIVHAYCPH